MSIYDLELVNTLKIDRSSDPYKIDPTALAQWTLSKLENISQGKLAKALGNTPPTITRWKRGEVLALHREALEAIAIFEGSNFDDVVTKLSPAPNLESKSKPSSEISLQERFARLEEDSENLKVDNRLLKFEIEELKVFIKLLAEEFHESRKTTNRHDQV